jgi:predicted N-acetyltransferase YhbS
VKPVPALVICHGQRIIGASALSTEMDAENHLLSGPCVLMEYRNRGLGTALLYYSLKQLRTAA